MSSRAGAFCLFYRERAHLKTSNRLTELSFYGNKLVIFDNLLFDKLLTLYTKCLYIYNTVLY